MLLVLVIHCCLLKFGNEPCVSCLNGRKQKIDIRDILVLNSSRRLKGKSGRSNFLNMCSGVFSACGKQAGANEVWVSRLLCHLSTWSLGPIFPELEREGRKFFLGTNILEQILKVCCAFFRDYFFIWTFFFFFFGLY